MARKKRVGVIGTFVWDVIHGRDPRDAPVEEWGGITYALQAFEAALPNEWEMVPILKVGTDLADSARQFVAGLERAAAGAAPIEVPYPNNRVTIHYQSAERRCEHLSGGVPSWSWLGLKPLLSDLDALYINLISGFELELETAQLVRQHFRGPIYCDLHSLLLAVQPNGLRTPQHLDNVGGWCRCFDLIQVNEEEMTMMAPDPMGLAALAFFSGVSSLTVTLGSRGVVYFAAPGFDGLVNFQRPALAGSPPPGSDTYFLPNAAAIRTGLVAAKKPKHGGPGDPTGCGDVWGATYFSRLLAGDKLDAALDRALDAAARNVDHRGATGLADHLRGELSIK
jgi:hypothetical protein